LRASRRSLTNVRRSAPIAGMSAESRQRIAGEHVDDARALRVKIEGMNGDAQGRSEPNGSDRGSGQGLRK
jgi:hypothetical protein